MADDAKAKAPARFRHNYVLIHYEDLSNTLFHHQGVIERINELGGTQPVKIEAFCQTHPDVRRTYYFLTQHPSRFQTSWKKLPRPCGVKPEIEVAPSYDEFYGKLPPANELHSLHNSFAPMPHKMHRPNKPAQYLWLLDSVLTAPQPEPRHSLLADLLSASDALLQPSSI